MTSTFYRKKAQQWEPNLRLCFRHLYSAILKKKLYANLEKKFDCQFKQYIIDNFKRFLDDCFILFTHSDEDLKKLHKCLNELHLSIKYTMEQNRSQFPFYDTLIINNRRKYKQISSTNPQTQGNTSYIHHVTQNTLKRYPYNLARKLKLTVSEETTLNGLLSELKVYI